MSFAIRSVPHSVTCIGSSGRRRRYSHDMRLTETRLPDLPSEDYGELNAVDYLRAHTATDGFAAAGIIDDGNRAFSVISLILKM